MSTMHKMISEKFFLIGIKQYNVEVKNGYLT